MSTDAGKAYEDILTELEQHRAWMGQPAWSEFLQQLKGYITEQLMFTPAPRAWNLGRIGLGITVSLCT